jgi:phosphonate transport system substrate-binding protein
MEAFAMYKIFLSTLMVFVTSIGLCGCEKREEKIINLGRTETALEKPKREQEVRIAVGGMITPKEGVVYYRDLLRYIQNKIGKKIKYVDRESYAEINEMLKTGKLEAAFVCSGPYTEGK